MTYQSEQFNFGEPDEWRSLSHRWLAFDRSNPRVYDLFKQFAFQSINAGAEHCSGQLVVERIRWEVAIQTLGEEFKVPNEYIPFMSRRFMTDFPTHWGFFEIRRSEADGLYPSPKKHR